jgi:signal transduction histidine kinase
MTRLRWRLLAAMSALVVVTVGASWLFTRRVTHDQVRRLLVKQPPAVPDQALRPLEDHLRAAGSHGIDELLDRMTAELGRRLVVTGVAGDVIAVSADLRAAKVAVAGQAHLTATRVRDGRFEKLALHVTPRVLRDAAGRPAAHVYLLPTDDPDKQTVRELAAADRRLIAIFAIAMLAALALTVLVSRRIVRPIEQLTSAVQQVGRGAAAHVPVSGRDEIARLAASFNAMVDAIARHEELRRRMVGDIAHELRTPLTNLRCELEAIQDGLAAPDDARISSIHDEVLHLQRLVEDLQDLAIAEAGELTLQRERIDLGAAVARFAGAQADVTGDDGVMVDADVTRLRQIVHNVLANAVRHGPAGERVQIRVGCAGGDATVSVTDRGPGIPARDLERIFERLYRVDEARGRERGGAGLGLAIVKRLVELHGGRVWAQSVEGEGATFTFTLPLASS